jgi:hypothetical protein
LLLPDAFTRASPARTSSQGTTLLSGIDILIHAEEIARIVFALDLLQPLVDFAADVIVGAFGADPNGDFSGSSYVVFGRASRFAAVIDLSTLNGTNDFRRDAGMKGHPTSTGQPV